MQSLYRSTLLVSSLALCTLCSAQATFRGLGYLPPGYNSQVLGMSRNGTTVVGAIGTFNDMFGFSWTAAGGYKFMQNATVAWDASDNGVIVGQNDQRTAFWSAGTNSIHSFTPMYVATGISADGSLIAGPATIPSFSAAVNIMNRSDVVTATVPRTAGLLGPFGVRISQDGKVVSGSYTGSQNIAFRWTAAGGTKFINDPDYPDVFVSGQSADGNILVGWISTPFGQQAFRWRAADGIQFLTDETTGPSQALAVSNDGNVIVGEQRYYFSSGIYESHPFMWTPSTGMLNLAYYLPQNGANVNQWHLDAATAVSKDGTKIAGYGKDPSGSTQGFYATITPPAFVDYPGVSDLTLQPASRVGGNNVSCRVDIGFAAGASTQVIFHSLNAELIPIPTAALGGKAGVLIPGGSTTAFGNLQTHGVAVPTVVNLMAFNRNVYRCSSMTLLPADIYAPTFSPNPVTGGNSTQMTINFNGEVPSSGATVALKSSDPAVQVPASAFVSGYAKTKTVTVNTSAVASVKQVTVTATYRNHVQNAVLTVNP